MVIIISRSMAHIFVRLLDRRLRSFLRDLEFQEMMGGMLAWLKPVKLRDMLRMMEQA